MPLRVEAPSSPLLGTWRPPLLGRLLVSILGVGWLLWNGEVARSDPPWHGAWALVPFAMAAALVVLPWRPLVRLHSDAIHVRGMVLSHVIPIQDVAVISLDRSGLRLWWGDGNCTTARFVGEVGLLGALFRLDTGVQEMPARIMSARGAYLVSHDLKPPPRGPFGRGAGAAG